MDFKIDFKLSVENDVALPSDGNEILTLPLGLA